MARRCRGPRSRGRCRCLTWRWACEQESEELGDEVIARLIPDAGAIENLDMLCFSTRLLRNELLELPVEADLRVANQGAA